MNYSLFIIGFSLLVTNMAPWQHNGIFFKELANRQVDVPVSKLAQEGYAQASRENGAGKQLVCRADVGKSSTDWIGPVIGNRYAKTDLGLIVTVKQGKSFKKVIVASGPDNQGEAFFFLPEVNTDKSYQVTVEAYDRDLYRHDKLETFTYQAPVGNKWHYQGKQVTLDCLPIAPDLFSEFLNREKQQFSSNLKKMADITVYDLKVTSPASLDKIATPARNNIKEIAALLGWNHQEVVALLQRLNAAEERLKKIINLEIEAKIATAKTTLTLPTMTITYEGRMSVKECPQEVQEKIPFYSQLDKDSLFFKIKLENKSQEVIDVNSSSLGGEWPNYLLGPNGMNDMPQIAFFYEEDSWQSLRFTKEIPPGQSTSFLLIPRVGDKLQNIRSLPLLLRFENSKTNQAEFLLLN